MSLDRFGATYQPYLLSLFRFVTGLLLFQYGVAKIFKFPALPSFADIPPLTITAGAIELVLGGLLMIGLFLWGNIHLKVVMVIQWVLLLAESGR